jgi:hypothetical protein
MAALEVIALDTSVPQLMAPQAGDTYTFPRAVEMPLGTANGVLFLNGSKVVTSGSALTFNGTALANINSGGTGFSTQSAASDFSILRLGTDTGNGYAFFQSGQSGTGTTLPFAWRLDSIEQMRLTSTGLGIGTSSPTNKLSVTGNANVTGNVTLGDASTDTVQVNGYMGVGATPTNNIALQTGSTALAGAAPIGIFAGLTAPSSATTSVRAIFARADTAASAFTSADVMQISLGNSTKGAGSTITNQHGVYIADQTQGTNNFGITSLVSSGTDKWNIYASGTAANYFAGNVFAGTTTSRNSYVGAVNIAPIVQVEGSTALASSLSLTRTTVGDPRLFLNNAGTVISGSGLGQILFSGSDGTQLRNGASISANVDGTPGSGDMPGRLIFSTTADGASSVTERMRIDSSGNLLVGTTASFASEKLSVFGSTFNDLAAGNGSGNTSYDWLVGASGNVGFPVKIVVDQGASSTTHGMSFYTSNAASPTERMRITSAGNVGIGTNSPLGELHVRATSDPEIILDNGTTTALSRLSFRSGTAIDGYVGLTPNSAILNIESGRNASWGGKIVFTTDTVERMRVTNTGNVGIGTSSPDQRVHAYIASGTARIKAETAGLTDASQASFQLTTPNRNWQIVAKGADNAFQIFDGTAPAERLRIDSNGNVGIGTSSPSASSILDAQSTTKGVRMPNMTTAQKNAIASPAAGLMVYDTTLAKLCVYTTAWETITSV